MEHLFNSKISEIETHFIDFYTEYGITRGQSSKIATISGFLSIYGSLTQQKLHELTKFSIGSISTNLNAMLSMGLIEKNIIKGKRKLIYSYFLSETFYDFEKVISLRLKYSSEFIEFLQSKETELNKQSDNNTIEEFIENIKEVKNYLQKFEAILLNYKDFKLE